MGRRCDQRKRQYIFVKSKGRLIVLKPLHSLEETLGLTHGALDVERVDVLPVLLEEGDQEVDRQHGVGDDLVLGHVDVADSDAQAENLLELPL